MEAQEVGVAEGVSVAGMGVESAVGGMVAAVVMVANMAEAPVGMAAAASMVVAREATVGMVSWEALRVAAGARATAMESECEVGARASATGVEMAVVKAAARAEREVEKAEVRVESEVARTGEATARG